MKSVQFKNLRSLNDTGKIELKPITVLVGKNSSGKSTMLRTFPLIKQSVETRTKGPILWYGRYVDFGSFKEAKRINSSNDEIIFGFEFVTTDVVDDYFAIFEVNKFKNLKWNVQFFIGPSNKNDNLIKKFIITIEDNEIIIEIDKINIGKMMINNFDFTKSVSNVKVVQTDNLLPTLLVQRMINDSFYDFHFRYNFTQSDMDLFNFVQSLVHKNTGDNTIREIISTIALDSSNAMVTNIKKQITKSNIWNERVKKWDAYNDDFINLKNYLIISLLDDILETANTYIKSFYTNTYYIAPVRATAERYYRLQDLAVDEVDFQGRNLAMFLRNLSDKQLKSFQEWTKINFGFITNISSSEGHISIKIKNIDANSDTNLADTGFGFSQMLPIITQLWFICSNNIHKKKIGRKLPYTLVIEQPELHLHPNLQAKLADAFITAIYEARKKGIELKIIIETHSDTIINRFGHNIYKKIDKFSSEDINIVLFEKENDESSSRVKIGRYDNSGFLIDWPIGFFQPEVK